MLIREIIPADADSYLGLRGQSEQEFPQFVGFNAEREMTAGPGGSEALMSSYLSEGTVVFGAFENTRLLGVAAMSRRLSAKYRHKASLWGMYVVPESRGDGVAQALMQAAIDWATEHPEVIAISLQVALSNVRAQHFYRRFGFSIFGTEERSLFAAGQYHGVHYMELVIKPA